MPLSKKNEQVLAFARPSLLKISCDATNIANHIWTDGIFEKAHMDIINSKVVDEDKMRLIITIYSQRANDLAPLKKALQEVGYEATMLADIAPQSSESDMLEDIKACLQLKCENVRKAWGKLLDETSLEKCFVEPEIVEEEIGEDGRRRRKETGKSVNNVMELFQTQTLGDRIVIEGDPGVGKTTYVNKLALDWSSNEGAENYSSGFLQSTFTTFFLIPLRSLNGGRASTFTEAANIQLRECGSWLSAKFASRPTECLLVLDAFDEYDGNCSEINEIIEGKLFPRLKVIITTRPSHLERLEIKNQWLSITGLTTPEKRQRFLVKQGWDQLEHRDMITYVLSGFGTLWQNPLYLAMLCVLYKAKKITGFEPRNPNCFHVLVKLFTEHTISRKAKEGTLQREGSQLEEQKRLKLKSYIQKCAFDKFSESNPWVQEGLITLTPSSRSVGHWFLNMQTNKSEDLRDLAAQYGLITIREEQSPVTGQCVKIVSFIHQLFLEYYAAVEFSPIFDNCANKESSVQIIKKNLSLSASPFSYFLAAECISYKGLLVEEQMEECRLFYDDRRRDDGDDPFEIHIDRFPWLPEIHISKHIFKHQYQYLKFYCQYRNIKGFWDADFVKELCSIVKKPTRIEIDRAFLDYHGQSVDHILSSASVLKLSYCVCGHVTLDKQYQKLTKFSYLNCSSQWMYEISLSNYFPNLHSLALTAVNITNEYVKLLCDSLKNLDQLRELQLSACFTSPQSVNCVIQLAITIQTSSLCQRLTKLELMGNILDTETESSMGILMRAISECVQLQYLDLSDCQIKPQSLDIIKDIIQNTSHLQYKLKSFFIYSMYSFSPRVTKEVLKKWESEMRLILPDCHLLVIR